MDWIDINEEIPNTYQTGDWDGKKSNTILVYTKNKTCHVAEMYEGVIDGTEFCDFVDIISGYEINDVTYWANIRIPI